MNRFLRSVYVTATARSRGPVPAIGPSRLPMRVMPNDIDMAWHMNNGVYLSLADLGRIDLSLRSGWGLPLFKARVAPVIMQQTITYRRSLTPGQPYTIETRLAGWDRISVSYEQRFLVGEGSDEQIAAQLMVRMRYLKKGKGIAPSDLWDLLGIEPPATNLPEWFEGWGQSTRLPSPRDPAPPLEGPFWS